MKIHIIGASGSGKTYLAGKLSEMYHIPAYELDDLFWDNDTKNSYSVKRDALTRNQMLSEILQHENWIIEGVQHSWVGESFEKADVIYMLETSPMLCRWRIVKRFVRRKCSGTSRRNETLKSLIALLKWTDKFYRVNLPQIKEILLPYASKVITVRSKKEIRQLY